jgi:hypothetical protein
MIAADVNDDGKINPVDLIQLRKLILGETDRFPYSNSWRFMNAIDDQPDYHILPNDEGMILNFTGIKIGDVDQSSDPAKKNGRSHSEVVLTTSDVRFSGGQKQTVIFSSEDLDKMRGFQFTIEFDPAHLTFMDLTGNQQNGFREEHFALHQLKKGIISVSWDKRETSDLPTSELFTLEFQASDECRLSDVLTLNSKSMDAEAYDQSLNIMNLALKFKHDNEDEQHFRLMQNWPNPFRYNTSISFELPEDMETSLRIFDLTGKVLKNIKGHYPEGVHEIKLEATDLTPGVLYYQLEAGEFRSTRKMILMEYLVN